jgi:hypothetical protein
MTTTVRSHSSRSRGLRSVLAGAWGMVSGVAPHVLHHAGPLAGAAVVAGTTGQVVFFIVGLAVATPLLIRLYRRFGTWVAPAIAVVIFTAAYAVSSLYLGPLITGDVSDAASAAVVTTTTDPHGH